VAVHFRLRDLLADRAMTQTELQLRTGLAYSTVNDLYNDKPRRVELETLDVLCEVLDCSISDILERIPGKKRART
jgi:putative transcriptional regulator